MPPASIDPSTTALMLLDLQNDFLHPRGAYARAGVGAPSIAALPQRLAPLVRRARTAGAWIVSTHFTLVPGRAGEPIIAPHLQQLRPFLARGDFEPGSFGHALVDVLAPADFSVEKIAYSAFHQSRLEWVLNRTGVRHLVCAGIVTNGGVASTVRDAHVRDFEITVLEDGCATYDAKVHEHNIAALASVAQISNIDAMLKQF